MPRRLESQEKNWLGFNLMQLNYWPCVISNKIHAACYKVVGSSPAAAVFNLGIANGAKVDLKLRLVFYAF